MNIEVNGKCIDTEADATVASLLGTLGLAEKRVAVECNGELVPRSLHASHALKDGDRVEIVQAIGGG